MSASPFPPPPVAAENVVFNTARATVTLVVEAGVDQRFWRMHTLPKACLVHQLGQGGRPAALKKIADEAKNPNSRILGVLDADLDRLEGTLPASLNVIWTDACDLEATLLAAPVLEKLVAIYAPDKLQAAEARWQESLRERLMTHATQMGRLRWLKRRQSADEALAQLKLRKANAKRPNYSACVDADWAPSLAKTVQQVIDFNNAKWLSVDELVEACAALPDATPTEICNGHDLIGYLVAGLRAVFKLNKKEATAERLEERLLDGYERRWLKTTQMWQGIRAWEAAHPGYTVLRAE